MIRAIQDASFKIKLRSINSIIGLNRTQDDRSGFAAVSVDLIQFSNQVNSIAENLTNQVDILLTASTNLKKLDRKIGVISRTRKPDQYLLKMQNEKVDWASIMKQSLLELNQQILKAIKVCKLGNVVVIFSKIEAAYMGSEAKMYSKLSDDVGSAIDTILESFEAIKDQLGKMI